MGGAESLLGKIGPVGLGFGVLSGAALLAGGSYLKLEEDQKKTELALVASGGAVDTTSRKMEDLARVAAASGKASSSEAHELELAFIATGKAGTENYGKLIAVARDYAKVTGQDVKGASQDLALAIADPIRAVELLDSKTHAFSQTQIDHIRLLVEQGDRSRATAEITDTLGKRVEGAASKFNLFGGTVHFAKTQLDEFLAAAGRVAKTALTGGTDYAPSAANVIRAKIATLDDDPGMRRASQAQRDRVRAAYEAEAKEAEAREAQTKAAQDRQAGKTAFSVAKQYSPGLSDFEQHKADLARMDPSRKSGWAGLSPEDAKIAEDRYSALKHSTDTFIPSAQLLVEVTEAQTRAAKAKTPAEKAAAAAELSRLEQSGKVVSAAEVQALATAKGGLAAAQAKPQHDRHAESLARELESVRVNARETLNMADAYMVSTREGENADAKRKALTAATKNQGDAAAQASAQEMLAFNQRIAGTAKELSTARDRTGAERAVNEMIANGTIALVDYSKALEDKLWLDARENELAYAKAHGTASQTAALEKEIALRKQNRTEQDAVDSTRAGQVIAQADDRRIEQLKLEAKYAGDLTGELQVQLAIIKAQQEAKDQDLSPEEGFKHVFKAAQGVRLGQGTAGDGSYRATMRQQEAALLLSKTELSLVGQSALAHDLVINRLQAELGLQTDGVRRTQEQKAAILSGVDALTLQNAKLRDSQAAMQEMQGEGTRLVDILGAGLNSDTWDGWKSAGLSAVKEIEQELIKMALLNPLKNAISGGSAPTISSLFDSFGKSKGEPSLDQALGNIGIGGGGSSNWLSMGAKLFGSFFGHNATGTDNWRGGPTTINEDGNEGAILPAGSMVTNAADTRQLLLKAAGSGQAAGRGGGGDIHLSVTVNAQDAVLTNEVKGWVAQGVQHAIAQAGSEVPGHFRDALERSQGRLIYR